MSYAAPNAPHSGVVAVPRRAYITTSAFNGDLYTYTVTTNPTTFVRTGTLAANVTGATASSCPANRILRENGKRLYPDANPQISTLMVGVYDAVSGLSGFIDPNAPRFAVYNSDKAYYMPNGIDPTTSLTDQGSPVYTRGTITTLSLASASTVTTTNTVTGGTGLIATTGQIRAATSTALATTATITLDGSLGQVYTLAQPSAQAHTINASPVPPIGSVVYIVVTPAGTAAQITWGTGMKGLDVTPTAARTSTYAFVSDGTNLCQFGGITASD
jgi:hypothetical protein